ncbi:hypothetical protein QFC19_001261 [Naganishia cerealis]|uniref:Uncharacterized protein n=1 Tax=Naganishia cerealis TaxID=610337 RepID=A0ACC2WI35_9TREE|nr:hypothetical protein QFC19_001261 [Naganishia cerealis]
MAKIWSKTHIPEPLSQNAADCDDQAVMKAAMRTMLSYKPRGTDDSSTDSITLVRLVLRQNTFGKLLNVPVMTGH